MMSVQVGPWYDRRELCQRCLEDYLVPHGFEKIAFIQLCGEWLCKMHYDIALETESASIKLAVRRAR